MTQIQKEVRNILWQGQEILLAETKKQQIAIIAGWGYGKSTFGFTWHFNRVLLNSASELSLVVAPDYRLVKQVCFEKYTSYLRNIGLRESKDYKLNVSELSIIFRWINHKVLFLSAEKPSKITAYTASHAWMDESGRCKQEARENLISRLRCPKAKVLQLLDTTTPEGFNFLYDVYNPAKLVRKGKFSESETKLLLHGSSYDNKTLPESFFTNLQELYGWDSDLYKNYVLGEFTNLSKNKFYFSFNEKYNLGDYPFDVNNKSFALSWDNNVGQMTWVVIQNNQGNWNVTNDNGGTGRNIEDCCNQFIDKFRPEYFKDFNIQIYGDAALHNRSVHSYHTGYDIIKELLQKHYNKITIKAHRANPFVEERSRATNRLFALKKLRINRICKKVIESVRIAETDGKGGIRKTPKDTFTHAMEAVDMAMIKLEPPPAKYKSFGVSY